MYYDGAGISQEGQNCLAESKLLQKGINNQLVWRLHSNWSTKTGSLQGVCDQLKIRLLEISTVF
jgi:hypothetical protein